MKNKLIAALALASLLAAGQSGFAQTDPAFSKELSAVTMKIQGKMRTAPKGDDGKAKKLTADDLKDEIKAIDDLIAKNKSKPENALRATQLKSSIYGQVLGDRDTAKTITDKMNTEYADVIKKQKEEMAARKAAIDKIQADLVVGKKFPDFDKKDLHGKPLSVANYKGKVVLIDFWATWCGPCVKELPHVLDAYNKYHKDGFEIIGISLDREQDKEKLETFIKEKNMPWQQHYDGGYWQNELATKYGINSIPATYLLDGQGMIIGKNLRGDALGEAVAKALKKS